MGRDVGGEREGDLRRDDRAQRVRKQRFLLTHLVVDQSPVQTNPPPPLDLRPVVAQSVLREDRSAERTDVPELAHDLRAAAAAKEFVRYGG